MGVVVIHNGIAAGSIVDATRLRAIRVRGHSLAGNAVLAQACRAGIELKNASSAVAARGDAARRHGAAKTVLGRLRQLRQLASKRVVTLSSVARVWRNARHRRSDTLVDVIVTLVRVASSVGRAWTRHQIQLADVKASRTAIRNSRVANRSLGRNEIRASRWRLGIHAGGGLAERSIGDRRVLRRARTAKVRVGRVLASVASTLNRVARLGRADAVQLRRVQVDIGALARSRSARVNGANVTVVTDDRSLVTSTSRRVTGKRLARGGCRARLGHDMAVRFTGGNVAVASIALSTRSNRVALTCRVHALSLRARCVSGAAHILASARQRRRRSVHALAGHVVVARGNLAATRRAQGVQLSLSQISVLAAQSIVARDRSARIRVSARHWRVDASASGGIARPNVARVGLRGAIVRLKRAVISIGGGVGHIELIPASRLVHGGHKITLRSRPDARDGVTRRTLRAHGGRTRQSARLHSARRVGHRIVERSQNASTETSIAVRVARRDQARIRRDALGRKSRSETLVTAGGQVAKGFLALVVGRAHLGLHIALGLSAVVSAH